MKISATDAWDQVGDGPSSADLAARVRSAHEQAESTAIEKAVGTTSTAVDVPAGKAKSTGAALRVEMETLVQKILAGDEGKDLVGDALRVIVAGQIDELGAQGLPDYQQEVMERMRADPVVLDELDDILQSIARELALRR